MQVYLYIHKLKYLKQTFIYTRACLYSIAARAHLENRIHVPFHFVHFHFSF